MSEKLPYECGVRFDRIAVTKAEFGKNTTRVDEHGKSWEK
jgi:hypothetical protein